MDTYRTSRIDQNILPIAHQDGMVVDNFKRIFSKHILVQYSLIMNYKVASMMKPMMIIHRLMLIDFAVFSFLEGIMALVSVSDDDWTAERI